MNNSSVSAVFTPDYQRILDVITGYRAAKIVLAASWHDLFGTIAGGDASAFAIAKRSGLDLRATEILLDALVSLDFLTKKEGIYVNSALAEEYLVKGKPYYLGNNLKFQELIWESWSDLKDVMQRGAPRQDLRHWLKDDPRFVKEYIRGMKNIAATPAAELAALLPLDQARSLLDVGAGPGTYSKTFLEKAPHLRATLLDLPETLQIIQEELEPLSLYERVCLLPADYNQADFGKETYDLVLMSHITHDEGEIENRLLFKKAYHALAPGGRLVVHDFVTTDQGTAPPFAAIFAVHMLVYTNHGRIYSECLYRKWLSEAGFSSVETHAICGSSSNATMAFIATRASTT